MIHGFHDHFLTVFLLTGDLTLLAVAFFTAVFLAAGFLTVFLEADLTVFFAAALGFAGKGLTLSSALAFAYVAAFSSASFS
jgi:hypothetical protein